MTEEAIWERIRKVEQAKTDCQVQTAAELAKLNSQVEHLVRMAETFVTKERFFVIQLLVFGFAGLMLTSVMGALIAKVIIK